MGGEQVNFRLSVSVWCFLWSKKRKAAESRRKNKDGSSALILNIKSLYVAGAFEDNNFLVSGRKARMKKVIVTHFQQHRLGQIGAL